MTCEYRLEIDYVDPALVRQFEEKNPVGIIWHRLSIFQAAINRTPISVEHKDETAGDLLRNALYEQVEHRLDVDLRFECALC